MAKAYGTLAGRASAKPTNHRRVRTANQPHLPRTVRASSFYARADASSALRRPDQRETRARSLRTLFM